MGRSKPGKSSKEGRKPLKLIKTAGETFNPNDQFLYFIAANLDRQQHGVKIHRDILIAVNEIKTEKDIAKVEEWIGLGQNLLIDSGIFTLAMDHSRRHNVSHDVGLSMAPEDIDGFGFLWDNYVRLMERFGDRVWGYIELDQGGRENKIKTRAELEKLGLRPIPVYHPLLDGWDYFDELAQNYDRICFGNIVQANRYERIRLVATAWERKQAYPHLWIHLLGFTANEWLNAYPIDSCDSSTWLAAVRWPTGLTERAAGGNVGKMTRELQYVLESEPTSNIGSHKACRMAAYTQRLQAQNWKSYLDYWGQVNG